MAGYTHNIMQTCHPEWFLAVELSDVYAKQRPLLVVVPKPFDKLVPVSLRDGKDLGKHTISFKRKGEQGMIVDVVSSSR